MDPLPAGWTEHADPSTGKSYFHNAGSGQTTWERPRPAVASPARTPLPLGWTEHADPSSGKPYFHNAATGQTVWERPSAPAAEAPLPVGWTSHLDASSGKTYFHNAATGQTTWERPAGGAAGGFGAMPMSPMMGGLGGLGGALGGLPPGYEAGTVKAWFEEKGFGFIAPTKGGPDVFCHRKELEDGQALQSGATVYFVASFDTARNKMGVSRCRGAIPGPGVPGAMPMTGGGCGMGMSSGGLGPAPVFGGGGGGMGSGVPGSAPPGGQAITGETQGSVKAWLEEKGFGFVAPLNGGNDVFVHRNCLQDGQVLTVGSTVTYVAEWDARRGKYAATRCTGASSSGGYGPTAGGFGGDARSSPYGGSAGGIGDTALQQAALQAQQALLRTGFSSGSPAPSGGFSSV